MEKMLSELVAVSVTSSAVTLLPSTISASVVGHHAVDADLACDTDAVFVRCQGAAGGDGVVLSRAGSVDSQISGQRDGRVIDEAFGRAADVVLCIGTSQANGRTVRLQHQRDRASDRKQEGLVRGIHAQRRGRDNDVVDIRQRGVVGLVERGVTGNADAIGAARLSLGRGCALLLIRVRLRRTVGDLGGGQRQRTDNTRILGVDDDVAGRADGGAALGGSRAAGVADKGLGVAT